MKKIVLISDSPYATTGLGRMSKYFLKMLPEFEWSIWGFLHPDFNIRKGYYFPAYDEKDFDAKFKLLSPRSYTDDQYGFDLIPNFIETEKPDYVITSMDFHLAANLIKVIKELKFTIPFTWINYFPMDREDYKELEADMYVHPDINVCITKFGVDKINSINPKIKIHQIYHPLDIDEFPTLTRSERRNFRFKTWPTIKKDTFLFGTVNRSFARKDTARLVTAFTKFLKQTKDTSAYIHGSRYTFEGVDLGRLAFENQAPEKRLTFLPETISEVDGVPQETLNKIYRSLDLFVTCSVGEGFGFTTVEALLTETPIIAPRNTCFPELVQDFGYLIDPTEYAFIIPKATTMWPVVNVDKIVNQMLYVKDNYKEAKEKAKAGSRWVKENLNLDIIAEQWRQILK
jgi:glycosyltransferase involved in cell wall biosynthesis